MDCKIVAWCTWLVIVLMLVLRSSAIYSNIYIRRQGVLNGKYFLSGRQLKFDCVYRKSFYKFVSFEHNGSVISPHFFQRYYIGQTTNGYDALIVSNTLPEDTGFWGCTLEDKRFGHQITAYTEVIYLGERRRSTLTIHNRAGAYQQPYQLECSEPGLTQWLWHYNNRKLGLSSRVQVLKNGTLHFVSLNFEDAGSYICYVKSITTGAFTIFATYDLDVYENVSIKIVDGLRNGYLTSGRELRIRCDYNNAVNFTTFEHNNTEISSGNRTVMKSSVTSASLVVSDTQSSDAGLWSCVIQKPGDEQRSMVVIVRFLALPEVTVIKEPFSRLVAGQRVTLTCIATGPNLLNIRWSKDRDGDYGDAVIGDYARTEFLNNGKLLRSVIYFDALTGAQQDMYRCTAENTAGRSYERINLIVLA